MEKGVFLGFILKYFMRQPAVAKRGKHHNGHRTDGH